MAKTVRRWVTIIDPVTGIRREQKEVPVETVNHANPDWEIISVTSKLLCAIKASILAGATCPEMIDAVRTQFHDDPELTDTRLYGVLEHALVYKLDSMEQNALSVKFQMPVEELQRRITELEQRKEEWKQGHELFAIPDLVREMITVKAKAKAKAKTKTNSRSKRKR